MGRGRAKKETRKGQVSGIKEEEEEEDDHHDERLADDDEVEEEKEDGKEGKFFACYLLTSLCPRFKGHTYIGFTVNPRRRIRQHNGEIRSGAFRTKRKRPWEMVLCIYGFPTNVAALQFEWAWQHPVESLAVRKAAANFKSLAGIGNKIKLAYTMLTLPSWQSLNLTVNFFSTKYKKHTAGCPSLPQQMRVHVCSMDDLPCYSGIDWNGYENDEWDDIREEGDGSVEDHQSVDDNVSPKSMSSQVSSEENVSEQNNCEDDRTLEQHNWSEEFVMRSLRDSPVVKECYGSVEDHPSVDDNITMEPNLFPKLMSSRASIEENVCEQTNCEEDRTLEQYNWSEEFVMRSPRDSPVVNVNKYRRQSFTLNDYYKDREMFTLAEECNDEVRYHSPTTIVADEEKLKYSKISNEVEVIDVFTPSPCYATKFGSKKRRRSIACPEIIDLTESPIVV